LNKDELSRDAAAITFGRSDSWLPSEFLTFLLTIYSTPKLQDQQAITIVARDHGPFDRAWEMQNLLEATVSYLELVISDTFVNGSITPHAADLQRVTADTDLNVVKDDAREIHFDDPAVIPLVYISSRAP
jgi:hypothetical protein